MPSQLPPEVLQALRDDDERNGAMRSHLIMREDVAKAILVVMSARRVEWRKPRKKQPPIDGHVGDLWDWAYSGVVWAQMELKRATKNPLPLIDPAVNVIKASRMMLPDGTPSKWARAIIEAEVADRVRKLRGPQKKEPPKK